jgi:hypothetical protein
MLQVMWVFGLQAIMYAASFVSTTWYLPKFDPNHMIRVMGSIT